MKSRRKHKNKMLKYILIFTIIIIVLFLIIKFLNNQEQYDVKNGTQDDTPVKVEPYYEKEEKKEVYPKNSYQFIMQYNNVGNLKLNDLYLKVYELKEKVKKISDETKKLSDKEVEKYYDDNIEEFKGLFGSKESFKEFVKQIEFLKQDNKKFSYAEFDLESFENIVDDYVSCNLKLNYGETNEISFNMQIAKNNNINKKYIFIFN